MNAKQKQSELYKYTEYVLGSNKTSQYVWRLRGVEISASSSFAKATNAAYEHYLDASNKESEAHYEDLTRTFLGSDEEPSEDDLQAQLEKAQADLAAAQAEIGTLRLENLALSRQVETLQFDDKIADEAIEGLDTENKALKAANARYKDGIKGIEDYCNRVIETNGIYNEYPYLARVDMCREFLKKLDAIKPASKSDELFKFNTRDGAI